MRKIFSISILFPVSLLLAGQMYGQQEKLDEVVLKKIREAEMSGSQLEEIAHYLTDVSGPRLPGSEGYKRAATWAIQTMKKWGLSNVMMEPCGEFGRQWDLDDFNIAMKLPYYQPLRAYPEPWSGNTNGMAKGKVIVLTGPQSTDTIYLREQAKMLRGKFILIAIKPLASLQDFHPAAERFTDAALDTISDQHPYTRAMMEQGIVRESLRVKRDQLLKNIGVLGIISAPPYNANGIVHVQAGNSFKLTNPIGLPRVSMSYEDGQRIERLKRSGIEVELSLTIRGRFSTADTKGYNVIAEIPGSDPELKSQIVMLGGHLDSWQAATGATDNAAGCSVVMEVVRLFQTLSLKPKRTIRLALWHGEEQGLRGSYNYVKTHFMNADGSPNEAHRNVSAYFNLDYGTGRIRGIFAQDNHAVKPIFEQWLAPFHDLDAKTVSINSTGSTDHSSFDWAGIPGFQFIQDVLDERRTHHTNLDDYDHLAIEDMKQSVIILASFVYQASMRPDLLPRKPWVKGTFNYEGR
jgi:carboxypeptidase Q